MGLTEKGGRKQKERWVEMWGKELAETLREGEA